MYETRIRQVMVEDGEECDVEGCPVGQGEDLVVLEVNGKLVLEMCQGCAVEVGKALLTKAFQVSQRRQRRLAGEPTA